MTAITAELRGTLAVRLLPARRLRYSCAVASTPHRRYPDVVPPDAVQDERAAADPRDGDAELVGDLRAGRPAAVAALYDRYGDEVERVVWRLLGADSEHDDIVQQTFIAAMTSIGRLADPRALKAWLRAIAVNTVRAELSRRTTRRKWTLGVWQEPVSAYPDFIARRELQAALEVLRLLPADERLAFSLRHVEGMSIEEAAAAMGVSMATFKRRLKDADDRFTRLARRNPTLADWLRRHTLEEPP